jgi:hypothetical protein
MGAGCSGWQKREYAFYSAGGIQVEQLAMNFFICCVHGGSYTLPWFLSSRTGAFVTAN